MRHVHKNTRALPRPLNGMPGCPVWAPELKLHEPRPPRTTPLTAANRPPAPGQAYPPLLPLGPHLFLALTALSQPRSHLDCFRLCSTGSPPPPPRCCVQSVDVILGKTLGTDGLLFLWRHNHFPLLMLACLSLVIFSLPSFYNCGSARGKENGKLGEKHNMEGCNKEEVP